MAKRPQTGRKGGEKERRRGGKTGEAGVKQTLLSTMGSLEILNFEGKTFQMSFKIRPKGVQNGVQMGPKWLPGGLLEPLGLLEASWNPLGGLLERSWRAPGPKKTSLGRLLAAPRGIPREVSAILGAKRLPKRVPKRVQNRAAFGICFGIDFGCVLGTPKS